MSNTMVYGNRSFIFQWRKSVNGYDSFIEIFTRRHFDNAKANDVAAWPFVQIKVLANNGEFVIDPDYTPFVEFCEGWITDPHGMTMAVTQQIERIERETVRAEFVYGTVEVNLNDFPYTVHKSAKKPEVTFNDLADTLYD